MHRALILLALVFVSALASFQANPSVVAKFADFTKKYHKQYTSEEASTRLEIFAQNLRAAEHLNSQSKTARFGVTKFSDLTQAEFKATYLGFKAPEVMPEWSTYPLFSEEEVQALPASWDWRTKGAVTPVKNQGQCGSCWSFSATGNMEGQWALAGNTLTGLSEQNLVDCDHECMEYEGEQSCDAGCDGGLMPNAFHYVMSKNGIDTEASYPYEAYDDTCKFSVKNIGASIKNWTYVSHNESQMAHSRGPGSHLDCCRRANVAILYRWYLRRSVLRLKLGPWCADRGLRHRREHCRRGPVLDHQEQLGC